MIVLFLIHRNKVIPEIFWSNYVVCNLVCQRQSSLKKCTRVYLHVIKASFVFLFSAHVLKEARIVTALNWGRKCLQKSSMLWSGVFGRHCDFEPSCRRDAGHYVNEMRVGQSQYNEIKFGGPCSLSQHYWPCTQLNTMTRHHLDKIRSAATASLILNFEV